MQKYDDARSVINKMAEVKLQMNAHKGDIEDINTSQLLSLLGDEMTELREACRGESHELMHVIEEAADMQNFLLAIVHRKIQQYRGRK